MSRLATLDNEVTFKKSFSDREVLETFVEDVTGKEFRAGKIETEKQFDPPVAGIKIRLDIFAESADGRVVLELQRVRYDSHFDRFLNYFLAAILQQVSNAGNYAVPRTVYTIVLLTAPYRLNDRTGRMVEDSYLISQLDPRTLDGQAKAIFGHQLIFLNPYHDFSRLPEPIQEWMRLILFSKSGPEITEGEGSLSRQIGTTRHAVIRAAELSLWDGMTPDERTDYLDANDYEQTVSHMQVIMREGERKAVQQAEEMERMRKEAEEAERKLKESAQKAEEAERKLKESAQQVEEAERQKEAALEELRQLRARLEAGSTGGSGTPS